MNILSLEIDNILSFEKLKLDFENSGLVLVDGWNHDAGRANGAGKTAIFNALAYGLFGKLPRKVTASEILRRGSKTGAVTVRLQIQDTLFEVTRGRPSTLIFKENGNVIQITQEEWESKLKFSYQQFIRSVYTAQNSAATTSPRFLLLNDSEKKNFLLELLELDRFNSCKKVADEEAAKIEKEIQVQESSMQSAKSKISAYQESLVDAELLKQQISQLRQDADSYFEKIKQYSTVKKPDVSKYQKIEDDIVSKRSLFASLKTKRSMLHDQFRKLNSNIVPFDNTSTCYACGANIDISDAKKSHDEQLNKLRSEMLSIKKDIDACDIELAKESAVDELVRKLKEKKNIELNEYTVANQQIQELNAAYRIRNNSIENLTLKLKNNDDLINKINNLQVAVNNTVNDILRNKRNIEFYNTISTIYSPTGAQAYVLDSIVESFNDLMEYYVGILWPNVSYKLNSYRENSKGDITAKFSETLTMDGHEVSTGSLSGGELKALSLCADFAILDVLENRFGLSTNIVILDEPFDGLDAIGRELVVELLENISAKRQIFVVDHASEAKTMFTKTVRVEKQNGISKLVT